MMRVARERQTCGGGCSNCEAVNVSSARFCVWCGAPLGRICPSCGAAAGEARYFIDCGTGLDPSPRRSGRAGDADRRAAYRLETTGPTRGRGTLRDVGRPASGRAELEAEEEMLTRAARSFDDLGVRQFSEQALGLVR